VLFPKASASSVIIKSTYKIYDHILSFIPNLFREKKKKRLSLLLTRPALFKYRCLDFREKQIPDEGRTRQTDVNEDDDDSVHNCVLRNAESERVKTGTECRMLSRSRVYLAAAILARYSAGFSVLFFSALSFFFFFHGNTRARVRVCVQ